MSSAHHCQDFLCGVKYNKARKGKESNIKELTTNRQKQNNKNKVADNNSNSHGGLTHASFFLDTELAVPM